MNIFLIDTNQCDLDKAKAIHEHLSAQLDDIITLPMNIDIETALKFLLDYQKEKEKEKIVNGTNS